MNLAAALIEDTFTILDSPYKSWWEITECVEFLCGPVDMCPVIDKALGACETDRERLLVIRYGPDWKLKMGTLLREAAEKLEKEHEF